MSIITVYKRRIFDDPSAAAILRALKADNLPIQEVRIENVMRIEGSVDESALPQIERLFVNPVIEQLAMKSVLDDDVGLILEISYKPAWTDSEMFSAQHAFEALDVSGVTWVRLATRYQLIGLNRETALRVASQVLKFNPQVKTIVDRPWATLIPSGDVGGVERLELRDMSLADLKAMSEARRLHMPDNQLLSLQQVFRRLARPARDGEVEFTTPRWSDHCDHTTFKALGLLPEIQGATERINHKLVVSAFVDNAGGMRFYDGLVIIFKGETHISPTFGGDPYGGIMTKHGGVIRDIIFMALGGWPIAGTTIMAICNPRIAMNDVPVGAFHPAVVFTESIRGTHDYTNPMGIPMAWSEYLVHDRNWKGFALGHSIGIIPEKFAHKGKPKPGSLVLLIGGLTGADGIHGATVSSASTTSETSTLDAAHVQIGAPIEERMFMEAIPVLRDNDCIEAATDLGAAGLGSGGGEMGHDCGGVWLNLAWVPLKCAGLRPWEIMMSESQERGLLAVWPAKLALARSILAEYGVRSTVIGMFTDLGSFQAVHDDSIDQGQWLTKPAAIMSGMIVADLPYEAIEKTPLPHIEVRERKRKSAWVGVPPLATTEGWIDLVTKHLGHFNIADQSMIAHRYDQTVQGNTVMPYIAGVNENMPDDLCVLAPIRDKPCGCGIGNAVNQTYGEVDPAGQGRLVYVDAINRLVAAGFSADEVTTCVNVYTPKVTDDPENAWDLVQLVKHGYVAASEALRVPVITGKDSSSGTFKTQDGRRIDAPITINVLAVGRCPDAGRLIKKPFRKAGDQIVFFHPGVAEWTLGGSVFLDRFGVRGDKLHSLDLSAVKDGWKRYYRMVSQSHTVVSRSAVSTGGLIRRMFEASIGSNLGCHIDIPWEQDPVMWLFGEACGSILFTAQNDDWQDWLGQDATLLGEVTDSPSIGVTYRDEILFTAGTGTLSVGWQKTVSEVL